MCISEATISRHEWHLLVLKHLNIRK